MRFNPKVISVAAIFALLWWGPRPATAQAGTAASDKNVSVGASSSESSAHPAVDSTVIPGMLLHDALPKYPKDARKQKLQGAVILRLAIAKDGSVSAVTPLSGDSRLAAVAESSLVTRKYEPFTRDGQPVNAQIKTVVYFSLTAVGPTVFAIDDPDDVPELLNEFKETRAGNGYTPPRALYSPSPPYTERARRDKYQGVCVLSLVVGKDGHAHHIRALRILGDGLDENAIATVRNWRFQPATQDGSAVAVQTKVEVAYHLY